MRKLSMPLAAALLLTASHVAAAQQLAAPGQHHANVPFVAESDDAVVRPLAVFRVTPKHNYRLPLRVTIADSAGAIVASFRLPGDGEVHPMMVTVQDDGLVLRADTRVGPLTVRLHGLNDMGPQRSLVGRWSLGAQAGELWGHAVR